ncbi:NADH dehydrogenase [ubiquinone] 1 beta subcomplex subunit 5, mitochondrial [Aphidius gifuensis]|uniref:NADH dehydrogenase [ubiquinone] 1 beta subcomplex subunit 5, mitochondrial n=1 Tax=Aphidius gifuensis TaxID=684658 RepID=UPI001CDB816F|nr:NADH dehydrogenase [ubiquinone] 1 beta subcomplex subunit 5, mitochondrial [Aphidius gifuensis]
MVAWSGLFRSSGQALIRNSKSLISNTIKNDILKRSMSEHRVMQIVPSRWHWDKTKDLVHLYFFVGAIPLGILIMWSNIFIGHAQLSPIPEGYVPKEWEYCRSPITRFFVKYIYTSEQQEYEKYCHFLWTEKEIMKVRELEKRVKELMSERNDYQAWYYVPFISANYVRRQAQKEKDVSDIYASA